MNDQKCRMKYLLPFILPIALLISCQKEDRNLETTHNLISFFPNISQTDTRAADEYSLSDYFNVCSTATVRMTTVNGVKIAKYRYNFDTKKLEYADGFPLYYPENNSPCQLILSWPDEETYTQWGETDYRHQEDEASFIRCDRLGDTINNAVEVECLPIYFKHVRSKLTFIPVLSRGNTTDAVVAHLTVNGYKSFYNTANPEESVYHRIYDPSMEAETTDINNNKVSVWLVTNKDTKIEFRFEFDASDLKAGENRKIKILGQFLYELKNNL
jgi:hypothetical protein